MDKSKNKFFGFTNNYLCQPFSVRLFIVILPVMFFQLIMITAILQAAPYEYIPADNINTIFSSQGLSILPEKFLREYDPITIFFEKSATTGAPRSEDNPQKYIQTNFKFAGEFRWIDNKTLQFRPASEWPALIEFYWVVNGIKKNFFTFMKQPVEIDPANNSRNLQPVKDISLSFKSKIEINSLIKMLTIKIIELPGIESQENQSEILTPENYTIKAVERSGSDEPWKYIISLKKNIPAGFKTYISLKLCLDDAVEGNLITYNFSTYETFQLKAAGCGFKPRLKILKSGVLYPREQPVIEANNDFVSLAFTAVPKNITLSDIKKLIRFIPAVEDMTFSVDNNYIYIRGKFEKEKLYKASIFPAEIIDVNNRKLDLTAGSEFYFYFRQAEKYIKWKQSEGILERYGYQDIPITGRGEEQIDLRIYRINPLSQIFWPFPNKPLRIDEGTPAPAPGQEPSSAEKPGRQNQIRKAADSEEEETENSSESDESVSSDYEKHFKLLGSPSISKIIKLPLAGKARSAEFGLPIKEYLKEISGENAPGAYLIGIRRLNSETRRTYMRIQVTDLCLSAVEEKNEIKFIVTSIKTAQPVENAKVIIQGIPYKQKNNEWKDVITGITDKNGIYIYKHKREIETNLKRILITKDDDMLTVNPFNPQPYYVNEHWYGNTGECWPGWLNQQPYNLKNDIKFFLHIFTERPIYKPGESIFIKGYIRKKVNGELFIPNNFSDRCDSLYIEITGPGQKFWRVSVRPGEYGSFDYTFTNNEAPTGDYSVSLKDSRGNIVFASKANFKIEAYKIPRFKIDLSAADTAAMDKKFSVKASGEYYAGGKLTDASAYWRITQYPYAYTNDKFRGYSFSTDDNSISSGRSMYNSFGTSEQTSSLDFTGSAEIFINPGSEIDAVPRVYSVEVTVTDLEQQSVTKTKDIIVLPPVILGIKTQKVFYPGEKIRQDIIAIDLNNNFALNVPITVRLLKREWHSYLREANFSEAKAEYITDVVDNKISEIKILTDSSAFEFQPQNLKAGVYIVEIETRDNLGRLQTASTDFYIHDSIKPFAWEKAVDNVFQTNADKKSYTPGDTARIIIKSPFINGNCLAVVEQPGNNEYSWIPIQNSSAVFELPIRKFNTPRIYTHFLLMRGRYKSIEDENSYLAKIDSDKPQSVASTCILNVEPEENKLKVVLEHKSKILPSSIAEIKIKITDAHGNPCAGEAALWLVDEAVLSLAREGNIDPLHNFIKPADAAIRITDYRNKFIGKILYNEEVIGDGSKKKVPDAAKKNTVRKNFKTVPYYNPSILIGNSGETTVQFIMSDDLTNYKIRSVICNRSGDKFGSAKSSISVRLPVIAQPSLPRFARPGDNFSAGAIGRIVEGEGGPGKFSITVKNAEIKGATEKNIIWNPEKAEKLYFPISIKTPVINENTGISEEASAMISVKVQRNSDNASDCFEVNLPIKDYTKFIELNYDTVITSAGNYDFKIEKVNARPFSFQQTLVLSGDNKIIRMADALKYLIRYPHGCLEQKISKVYSMIALRGILDKYRMNAIVANADEQIKETIKFMQTCMQSDGLIALWPGNEGAVHLTAYSLEFLAEAKRTGYKIPDELYSRLISTLTNALRSDYSRFIDGQSYFERVEALCALAQSGIFDPSYSRELANRSDLFKTHTAASILFSLALNKKNIDSDLLKKSSDNLMKRLVFKLRGGSEEFYGVSDEFSFSGNAIFENEKRSLASAIRALRAAGKSEYSAKIDKMINYLLSSTDKNGWGSTNANAAALLTLKDIITMPDASYKYPEIKILAGNKKESITLNQNNPVFTTKFYIQNPPSISTKKFFKPVYASLKVKYIPDGEPANIQQRNNGFIAYTELIKYSDKNELISKFPFDRPGKQIEYKTGDIIEVHVQLTNPDDRHFIAVSAPFAAGFEPMNPNLITSSPLARPAGDNTRQPDYSQYLDDEVRFYFNYLPKGNFDFYFRLKATVEGEFSYPPVFAEAMYNPEIFGSSYAAKIKISGND